MQRLIQHFRRYGLAFELDEKASAVLAEVDIARNSYRKILADGLKAKKAASSRTRRSLLELLRPNFLREPTRLQLDALHHLLVVGNGGNFSVPGSGKTTVALAYYHILRIRQEVSGVLVIGPASCFRPWEEEYRECFGVAPRSVRVAGKPQVQRRADYLLAEQYELLLTTYHSAARDVRELIPMLKRRSYLVVLDESHYIKRPQGGTLADAVLTLAPYAKRRLILTGTPMPNGLPDLWSQFTFLWHDQLPLGHVDVYLRNVEAESKEDTTISVKNSIEPLFFRTTKRQLGLPRPSFNFLRCSMNPLQARIYTGVAGRFLSQTREAPRDREALREWRRARSVRLLQIASNPALLRVICREFQLPPLDISGVPLKEIIDHYPKYEIPTKILAACDLVRKICSRNQKVIVWSTFVHNLRMLASQLQGFCPVVIHGGVPIASSNEEENREHLIQRFKTAPDCLVLLANPAACAESISLHHICHDAIYLDRSFNCAHYLQSLDRIHRLGLSSRERISYHVILANDSIDEIVNLRLEEKMHNMERVIEEELPGEMPGYWSEDLGEEEERDFQLVEEHMKKICAPT